MSLNGRVITIARGLVGVQAGDPATHDRFVEILGIPADPQVGWEPMLQEPFSMTTTPDGSITTTGVSTCALVARGILREAGVQDPSFEAPYVTGSGLSSLVELARRSGALHQADQYVPVPGDVAIVNNGNHVTTFVDDLGDHYRTVDGGVVGAQSLQAIDYREGPVRSKSLVPGWIVIETQLLPHRDPWYDSTEVKVIAMALAMLSGYGGARYGARKLGLWP